MLDHIKMGLIYISIGSLYTPLAPITVAIGFIWYLIATDNN